MVFIPFKNLLCLIVQRNTYRYRIALFGFFRYVFNGFVHHVQFGHSVQVAYSASYKCLENEDVPLYLQLWSG